MDAAIAPAQTPEQHVRAVEYLAKSTAALEGAAAEIRAAAPLDDEMRSRLTPALERATRAMDDLRRSVDRSLDRSGEASATAGEGRRGSSLRALFRPRR